MTDVVTDFKPEPRIKDSDALARARLMFDECASCGKPPANAHHFLPKGSPWHGDDVVENIVLLCGSGSFGCHGAVHGSPYQDGSRRWTTMEVRAAIGEHVLAQRPDVIEYVLTKLGWTAGREYLATAYYLRLPDDYAAPE